MIVILQRAKRTIHQQVDAFVKTIVFNGAKHGNTACPGRLVASDIIVVIEGSFLVPFNNNQWTCSTEAHLEGVAIYDLLRIVVMTIMYCFQLPSVGQNISEPVFLGEKRNSRRQRRFKGYFIVP